MEPLTLIETGDSQYSLLLDAGMTAVDAIIEASGHEPNGYFWEGIASVLCETEAPGLNERFELDSEAGMFCAFGPDRASLEALGNMMSRVASESDQLQAVMAKAAEIGFEFDD